MKLNFVRPMILTAALFTVSAAANAQTGLIAKVPFAFRMNGINFPSGSYRLAPGSGATSNLIRIQDVRTGKAALSVATAGVYGVGEPRLVFRCSDAAGCVMTEASDGGLRWTLPKSHEKVMEYETLAVIPLRRSNAE